MDGAHLDRVLDGAGTFQSVIHIPGIFFNGWGKFQTEFWMDGTHSTQFVGWMGHIPDRVLDG